MPTPRSRIELADFHFLKLNPTDDRLSSMTPSRRDRHGSDLSAAASSGPPEGDAMAAKPHRNDLKPRRNVLNRVEIDPFFRVFGSFSHGGASGTKSYCYVITMTHPKAVQITSYSRFCQAAAAKISANPIPQVTCTPTPKSRGFSGVCTKYNCGADREADRRRPAGRSRLPSAARPPRATSCC